METYLLIFKLSIVLAVGFIGAIIARKFKLPNVSGYLVLGLLLGPSWGLLFPGFEGIITPKDNENLKFLSEIALAFIAFSIGSEFAIKSIKKMGKSVIILTTFEVLGAVALVFIAMLFVPKPEIIQPGYQILGNNNIAFAMILASMSAATAPAATLLVIRQYRAYGPVTKNILPITALDDIYGIVVFGFFISIAQILAGHSTITNPALMFSKPFIEVFGSIILGMVIGFILSKISNLFKSIRDDIQVLSITAILFTIGSIYLLNHYLEDFGLEFSQLLANIMVGSMVANIAKKPESNFNSINDLATPFFVIFFVLAGASLDLGVIRSDILVLGISVVYIIARGSGKILGIAIGAKIVKSEPTVKKYLGIALLPQGGVSIGLLVVVYSQMKSFYPVISTIIMLSILVYETMGPIFAKYSLTKSGELYALDRLNQPSELDDSHI